MGRRGVLGGLGHPSPGPRVLAHPSYGETRRTQGSVLRRGGRHHSRLPGGALNPFPPELLCNFLMRNRLPCLYVSQPSVNGLDHVEVVENVLYRAVVRQTVEELPDFLFRCHADSQAYNRQND